MNPPMIVVGALRTGGSGKTSVAMALGRHFQAQGMRVAILAYWMKEPRLRGLVPGSSILSSPLFELKDGMVWREASDEALLIQRKIGAPVFLTRNRWAAWKELEKCGTGSGDGPGGMDFDVVVSDDGFQDVRLKGAFHLLLRKPGEKVRYRDLLPAGNFREGESAAGRAHCVAWEWEEEEFNEEGYGFCRELSFPDGVVGKVGVICGLPQPDIFVEALEKKGLRVEALLRGQNHCAFEPKRLERFLNQWGHLPLLCSEKDWEKLPAYAKPQVSSVTQEIRLSRALLRLVDEAVVASPLRRCLVH